MKPTYAQIIKKIGRELASTWLLALALIGWHTILFESLSNFWATTWLTTLVLLAWLIKSKERADFLERKIISFLTRHLFINYGVVFWFLFALIKSYSFLNEGVAPQCPQGERCIWDLANNFIKESWFHQMMSVLTVGAISDLTACFLKKLSKKESVKKEKDKNRKEFYKFRFLRWLVFPVLIASYLVFFVSDSNYLHSMFVVGAFVLTSLWSSCRLYREWKRRLSEEASRTENTEGISVNERHDLHLLFHILIGNAFFFGLYYLGWQDARLIKELASCGGGESIEYYCLWEKLTDVLAYTLKIGDTIGIDNFNSTITAKLKAITIGQIVFNLIDIGFIILSFGTRGNFLIGKKTEGPNSPNDPEKSNDGAQVKGAEEAGKNKDESGGQAGELSKIIESLKDFIAQEKESNKKTIDDLRAENEKLKKKLKRFSVRPLYATVTKKGGDGINSRNNKDQRTRVKK